MTDEGASDAPAQSDGGGEDGGPKAHPVFDTSVAHQARMYNYALGGKDNYAADRAAVEEASKLYPATIPATRANRAFLGRVVRYLAGEAGIRQFLDLGTGIPTAGNTHEVAQEVAPDSRVVYVDYDPVVLAYARALLTSAPEGATDYIDGDIRDITAVLERAARTLDFTRPVAVTMLAILHAIGDRDDPYRIVSQIVGALAPGSCLAISHTASDIEPEKVAAVREQANQASFQQFTWRSHDQVLRFFDGLEMVEPGLVQVQQWRPGTGSTRTVAMWGGVGRKPGPGASPAPATAS